MDGNVFVCLDVGQYQMWVVQFYCFNKLCCWINFGGFGMMGFGLLVVMGVKMVYLDDDVLCIMGEGLIQMCIQELLICLQYDMFVKIILLNNCYFGMVCQWQQIEYSKCYLYLYMDVLLDFVKFVEVYGYVGMWIEKILDVELVLKEVLCLKDCIVFFDFQIDLIENVWLMVQVGKGIIEMLFGLEDL